MKKSIRASATDTDAFNATRQPRANDEGVADGDLAALIGGDARPRRWWLRPSLWIGLLLLAALGAGAAAWQARQRAAAAPRFVTEAVGRGTLNLSVTANGTLQPTRTVSIGSELSGTVARVLVDVNDPVKKGQVLVELDTSKLRDQVVRSRATLASAQASVAQAMATVKESQGNLARLEEVARLSGGKVPAQSELDTARATLDRARADEASARASVANARAALSTDETNLSKASIRSPIDGVVLTRTVDPGNAVAASLQAVTLFTIAEDMSRLKLQVNVDEADVGSVSVGQHAAFTVSAYANRKYPAAITRVAYGSTTTDNVVTYVTWMDVDNADLSLRPGMTATATITSLQRKDVLLVPNMALRFTPTLAAKAAGAGASGSTDASAKMVGAPAAGTGAGGGTGSLVSRLMPRPPGGNTRRGAQGTRTGIDATSANTPGEHQVWIVREGRAVPVKVVTGASDGRMTEITGGDLSAGTPVITDQRTGKSA